MAKHPATRFLVTGATGFIGSYLTAALVGRHGADCLTAIAHEDRDTRGEEALARMREQGVKVLEGDLLNLGATGWSVPDFDVVYHLAAFAETEQTGPQFRVNGEGTLKLLEWLGPSLRGKRLILSGTLGSVDRDDTRAAITEETPCTPKTTYGRTKLLGEEYVRELGAELGYDYTILRLCTVIGRGYRANGMFGRCPQLLAEGKLAARLNWPGRVSFLSVRDLVEILLELPTIPAAANETFVMSNGENPSFDELLEQMAGVLGVERRRIALPRWLWALIGKVAWPMASAKLAPYEWRIFCWRVAHIVTDGICADATKFNNLVGRRYRSVLEALRETYGK